jgi:hypothetical protein
LLALLCDPEDGCFELMRNIGDLLSDWMAITSQKMARFELSFGLCACRFDMQYLFKMNKTKKTKLHGLSPRANYTDRATAACRQSDCQVLRIEGATWSAWRIPTAVFSVF